MNIPFLNDIRNDAKLTKNVGRIALFLILFFVLDNLVSFVLLKGIERYYGLKSNSEVLLVGHSHLMLTLDKELIEKKTGEKVAKYTREGVNISDRRIMIEHYFSGCTSKPEIVVLGIDPWLFSAEGLSSNSYQLFLPFIGSPEIKNYIKTSVASKADFYRAEIIKSSRYNALLLNASMRGYMSDWSNLKFGVIDSTGVKKSISNDDFRKITFNKDLINDFAVILDFLNQTEADVLLLNTPLWQPLINAQSDKYNRSMFLIDSLKNVHCPSSRIVDLVPKFSGRTKYFFDPIHLNPDGQRVVTEYFSTVLDSISRKKGEANMGPGVRNN